MKSNKLPETKQELIKLMIRDNITSFLDFAWTWDLGGDFKSWDTWYICNWTWLKDEFNLHLEWKTSKKISIMMGLSSVYYYDDFDSVFSQVVAMIEDQDSE